MPLLGRIFIASCHSVVPIVCPCFYRSFSFCLAFLFPFVWFATARNDIAPSRLYSILSSLISIPICIHARKVRRKTFPALFAHSLSRLHCWHIASPPSLYIVSLQSTCCCSLCSMILYSYPSAYLRQAASVGLLRLSCSIFFILSFFHCFILLMLMRFCLPMPLSACFVSRVHLLIRSYCCLRLIFTLQR